MLYDKSDSDMNHIGVQRKHLPWGNVMKKVRFEVDVKDRGRLPLVEWKREHILNVGLTWVKAQKEEFSKGTQKTVEKINARTDIVNICVRTSKGSERKAGIWVAW